MSASTLESRRISDPRFKLKNILDLQAQQLADQINPADLQFQDQTISSYSRLLFIDEPFNYAFNGTVSNIFYTPFEPDFQYLTLHLYCDNTGNLSIDRSGFKNHGNIGGNPNLVDAINVNNGYGTTPSLEFDGQTNYIDVINNTSISPSLYNTSLGFTLFCYIRPEDISNDQYGYRRTITAKSDSSSAGYAYILCIDSNGDLLFHVMFNGTEYKVKASNTISITSTLQIIATFDAAASPKTATLTVNNVNFTTPSTTVIQPYPSTSITPLIGDVNLHIGRSDNVAVPHGGAFDPLAFDSAAFEVAGLDDIAYPFVHGAYAGQMYDFRYYARPLTSAERINIWNNKSTIFDAAAGTVGLAGFSVANP